MKPSPPPSPDCEAFEQIAQAVLDGTTHPQALNSDHAQACYRCRQLAASVRVVRDALATAHHPVPALDDTFTERVVLAARMDRRSRMRRRQLLGSLAMAAGLLVAVVSLRPWFRTQPDFAVAPTPQPAPVVVAEQFAEASSAIASLTVRTADETVAPTLSLLPTIEAPRKLPDVTVAVHVPNEPAVESLTDIPQAMQTSLEPMTNSAFRAFHLFLRDTGLSESEKPKS